MYKKRTPNPYISFATLSVRNPLLPLLEFMLITFKRIRTIEVDLFLHWRTVPDPLLLHTNMLQSSPLQTVELMASLYGSIFLNLRQPKLSLETNFCCIWRLEMGSFKERRFKAICLPSHHSSRTRFDNLCNLFSFFPAWNFFIRVFFIVFRYPCIKLTGRLTRYKRTKGSNFLEKRINDCFSSRGKCVSLGMNRQSQSTTKASSAKSKSFIHNTDFLLFFCETGSRAIT